jgi:glucosamine-6-phosphate deaminase
MTFLTPQKDIYRPTVLVTPNSPQALAALTLQETVQAFSRSMRARIDEGKDFKPVGVWPVGNTQTQKDGFYDLLKKKHENFRVPEDVLTQLGYDVKTLPLFANTHIVQLDEPEGLTHFRDTLRERIQTSLGIEESLCHYFDGKANIEQQAAERQRFLQREGLDVFIGGIGSMDIDTQKGAHIGYNEAGSTADDPTRVLELAQASKDVLFDYDGVDPDAKITGRAITIGMQEILSSRFAFVMANGSGKAAVVKASLEDEISSDRPASFMRHHANAVFLLDEDAAAGLSADHDCYDLRMAA